MNNAVLRWTSLLTLLVAFGCAEKKTRVWIDPPVGYESARKNSRNLYYQVEDAQSGRKESVAIPVDQVPQQLVVENRSARASEDATATVATRADQTIHRGKLPESKPDAPPTISYLKGIREVEELFQKQRFGDALIKLTPLLEQYPKQPRLFAMQGTLYRKVGEKKLALVAYQRAHELDQDNPAFEEAYLRLQDEIGATP